MAKLFQTGNSTSETLITGGFEITDNVWLKAAFYKAVSLMCDENNWQKDGDATVEFARDKSNELYESIDFMLSNLVPVGSTMIWHMDLPPYRWLICDGTGHLKTEYPELFALFGTKYGTSPDYFGVPDLRSRIPYGADFDIELDDEYGEATHTLTTSEMPQHNHADALRVGTGSPVRAVVSSGGSTNVNINAITANNGGGEPHNNMPPVYGVNFIVYAGKP